MISRLIASIVMASGLVAPAAATTAGAAPAIGHARPAQRLERVVFRGYTAPAALSSALAGEPQYDGLEFRHERRGHRAIDVHPAALLRSSAFAAAAVPIPVGPNLRVVGADPDFFAFPGLTHADQRDAGTGEFTNSQFSLEPPDQGLCAGNGYVVDVVNDAVAVYSNFGTRLTAPTALNAFFEFAPEVNRTAKRFGTSVGDPKCYFDRDTQRWFLSEYEIAVDPATGVELPRTGVVFAVSRTADPTGAYGVYSIDSTDAQNPGCPCFGDQPLLGADANGIYISTNEFSVAGSGFNGAQIFALSKWALARGVLPTVVHIDAGALPTPDIGGTWYSVQPSTSPDTSTAGRLMGGTEYLLSSLDFFNLNDNRIAEWAITNTRSLQNRIPTVGLQHVVVGSVGYSAPPPASQEAGPAPLAQSLHSPLEDLDTNDDRMNQVVFADGRLWSGVNTAVRSGRTIDAGIAYFAVVPKFAGGYLTARVVQQGYVAVAGQNMMFPSIGVNTRGGAVMAATLSGPDYFPSAVYVTTDGYVHLAAPGAGPDDGFTGYKKYGGAGIGRWGDYSAAVADADGSIWFAAEYIPASPRTLLANWGTFIGHAQVHR